MQRLLIALALGAAACSPPAAAPTADAPAETPASVPATTPVEATAVDLYTNNWNSNEISRFTHVLHAPTPGVHALTLSAHTNSPGGQTVGVYPLGPDGEALSPRMMFVVASHEGETETSPLRFPASGEGVPVMIVVEKAGDRAWAGSYTITVAP
jgi:hypothetical protein